MGPLDDTEKMAFDRGVAHGMKLRSSTDASYNEGHSAGRCYLWRRLTDEERAALLPRLEPWLRAELRLVR